MTQSSTTFQDPISGATFCAVDVETSGLHSALPDARAAGQVFVERVRRIPPMSTVKELPGLIGPFDRVARPRVKGFEPTGHIEELEVLARWRLSIEMDYEPGITRGPVVVTPLYLFHGNGTVI